MKFVPITVSLKNGDYVLIREASVEDAEMLITAAKKYMEESEFIPVTEGEFSPTLEEEISWIENINSQPNSLLLIALVNETIIGSASLIGGIRKMTAHTSMLGLGLNQEWRGMGIGSYLIEVIIGWAKNNSILEYISLETMDNNKIGMKTYEKFGFKEIGRKPEDIKINDNMYRDTILMTLKLK